MHAYDRLYLERARITMGCMLDHAVNDLKIGLGEFYGLFLMSGIADSFGKGDPEVIAGHSGAELSRMIIDATGFPAVPKRPSFRGGRSREYWCGRALAYYQWSTGRPFSMIEQAVPVTEIRDLYSPYHEMDIRQFADHLDELIGERFRETALARYRKYAGLSQGMLAKASGVSVRTIQQYEQRQKDIGKAGAEQIRRLSSAIGCRPEVIIGT